MCRPKRDRRPNSFCASKSLYQSPAFTPTAVDVFHRKTRHQARHQRIYVTANTKTNLQQRDAPKCGSYRGNSAASGRREDPPPSCTYDLRPQRQEAQFEIAVQHILADLVRLPVQHNYSLIPLDWRAKLLDRKREILDVLRTTDSFSHTNQHISILSRGALSPASADASVAM